MAQYTTKRVDILGMLKAVNETCPEVSRNVRSVPMELNSCINFILSNTQNAVYNYFKKQLQDFDVTPSQYALLQCLWVQDGLTPSQLAQTLRLDTSSITGILGRLEKKGLISRVYSQEDRRSVRIHLREEGRALWTQVDRVIEDANAKITSGLDADRYQQLLSSLSLLEHNTED